jgi:acyl transferase domain-containing protein
VHAVELLRKRLTEDGVASLRVPTRHAFHSAMMVPIRDRLADLVATFELRAPTTPFLSNTSGTWISAEEATDSGYWAGHLHRTVRFHDNLTEVWRRPGTLAVEVGAGQMLTGFAAQHPECPRGDRPRVFATLPGGPAGQGDVAAVLTVLGRLWEAGVPVDWPGLWPKEEW